MRKTRKNRIQKKSYGLYPLRVKRKHGIRGQENSWKDMELRYTIPY